jgi:hypothetical protein
MRWHPTPHVHVSLVLGACRTGGTAKTLAVKFTQIKLAAKQRSNSASTSIASGLTSAHGARFFAGFQFGVSLNSGLKQINRITICCQL